MLQVLHIQSMEVIGLYLGCPNIIQRRSKEDFVGIKSRINKRLASWKARTLSTISKVVLIKFNITSISQDAMNLFEFSKYVCIEIH